MIYAIIILQVKDEQRNFEHAHVYNRNSCRDGWCATICGGDCYLSKSNNIIGGIKIWKIKSKE